MHPCQALIEVELRQSEVGRIAAGRVTTATRPHRRLRTALGYGLVEVGLHLIAQPRAVTAPAR